MNYNYNVVKNADNPPELIWERFCSFSLSRFLLSMSCNVDFLLLVLVLNGLLGLMELAVVAKGVDGWLAGVLISAIGLGDTWGVVTFRFLDGKAVEFPLCKGVE